MEKLLDWKSLPIVLDRKLLAIVLDWKELPIELDRKLLAIVL